MNANELRIGNFVYGIEQGYKETALPVACIHNDNTIRLQVGDETVGCYNSKIITPIPITKDWLGKFGFDGRNDFKWLGIVGVQLRDDKYYISLKDLSNVLFHSIVEIKHVHQLQNLYFALTGEELTLE